MSSAEEIAAFKNETTNAPMCSDIGIAFGQVAEAEDVLLNYTPAPPPTCPPPTRRPTAAGWPRRSG
jgi:putative spermidine/putrescine transport system substrate-binding protein